MMADRPQKKKALQYVLSKHWFPQLELDVTTHLTIGNTSLKITDVDVFASIPDDFIGYRNILIDCKTYKDESPISRALWQKGLLERLGADRGICILKKGTIERDHRYTAAHLGIILLTEHEFEQFARATSQNYDRFTGQLSDTDIWESFFSISSKFKNLAPAIRFSQSIYWMIANEAEACRRTLTTLLSIRSELDPTKKEHVAVVADLASLFMHALSIIVSKIFLWYLQPTKKEDLSNALLLFLYGGRESYNYRNSIKKMFEAAGRELTKNSSDLSLPEWDQFTEFVRQTLDAPYEVNKAPILIREIGWCILANSLQREFAKKLATNYPQGARLAIMGIEYFTKAAKLPPEFSQILTSELLSVQIPK